MSQILARANALEWAHYRDDERYHPLRDGARRYAAVWVVDTMRRFLPPEHVALAHELHAMARYLEGAGPPPVHERVDQSPCSMHGAVMRKIGLMQEMAGYEQAALIRVGGDGRGCFRGMVGGDSQAELARRVGYPESSKRSLRRLVQVTLETLADYHDENQRDPT